jgi:hypothetical protein
MPLSSIFKGECLDTPGTGCVAFLHSLPLFYFSLKDHQKKNFLCVDFLDKTQPGQNGIDNVGQRVFSYYPKGAKRCLTVPASWKPVLLNYFHNSVLSGHLGAVKAF